MSNVSIYEKNWIDLVFEDKNKAYGAYQLRQENQKTTLFALLGGVTFALAIIAGGLFLSSFGEKPNLKPTDEGGTVITISDFHPPKKEEGKKEKVIIPLKKTEALKKIDKKNLLHPILVKANENPDDVKTNKEMKENASETKTEGTNTTGSTSSTAITGTAFSTETKSEGSEKEKGPVTTNELDRLPEYPGGIKKFYDYVGNNFEKPDVDDRVSSLNVIMSFVIEKDGTMTDINVLRSSDKSIEREAIRVLKSLKIKWSPGFKDGEKVRVLYTLPIKVAL